MESVNGASLVGAVQAFGTHGRGLNVDELTDLALRKIIYIADTCHPEIREQANQFKERMRPVIARYMHQAIKSDRTTLYNQLRGAGFPEVADIILKI